MGDTIGIEPSFIDTEIEEQDSEVSSFAPS